LALILTVFASNRVVIEAKKGKNIPLKKPVIKDGRIEFSGKWYDFNAKQPHFSNCAKEVTQKISYCVPGKDGIMTCYQKGQKICIKINR
jgi:hypothetical protein